MKFRYSGYNKRGTSVNGTFEAADRQAARDALRREGTIVLEIKQEGEAGASRLGRSAGGAKGAGPRVGTGLRLRRVCMFARQLQVLLGSGTPILQSISALQRQGDKEDWRRILGEVHKRVEEGSPLSEGLRACPQYFDSVTLSLVAAGEASGNMPAMFERLSILTRKQLQLRSAITGALVYPCILVSLGLVVLLVMLLFVLPRFEELFHQIDGPLPITTVFLLHVSTLLRSYWWAVIAGAAVCGLPGYVALKRPSVRNQFDAAMLRLPKIGRLLKNIGTAKVSRMLGTLLECKVPLLEALELTQDSLKNQQYVDLVRRAHEAVTRGEAMSTVFASSDLVSPCVQEAIIHGESSGQVGPSLVQMADFLDEENDAVVKGLTKLIEPAILAVLGVIVGGIAMSMFLPLFDLVSSANGGH